MKTYKTSERIPIIDYNPPDPQGFIRQRTHIEISVVKTTGDPRVNIRIEPVAVEHCDIEHCDSYTSTQGACMGEAVAIKDVMRQTRYNGKQLEEKLAYEMETADSQTWRATRKMCRENNYRVLPGFYLPGSDDTRAKEGSNHAQN